MRNDKSPPVKGKITQRNKRRLFHAGVLITAGALFTLIIALVQPFYTFNLWFSDQFISTGETSPNIVVAGIDDASLAQFGKWSEWPRTLHAQAVANLEAAGAAVIGYDVIFTDTSANDQTFAAAINKSSNVVLGAAGTERIAVKNAAPTYQNILLPAAVLEQADGANTGHVNIVPDPDGKVRQLPLIIKDAQGDTYPSLAVAALFTLFHKTPPQSYPLTDNKLTLLMRDIPVDSSYFMRLNFTAVDKKPVYLSYGDIINNKFDPALVKNKIVLVGMTATGDVDEFSIPNSSVRIPGVFLHAAAVDTILRTQFLTVVPLNITLLIMLLLILLCAVILPLFGTWHWTDVFKGVGLILGVLMVYVVVSSILAGQGQIFNVLYPALLLLILFITNILYMIIREQGDKKFVKELFGRYVSPQISNEIVNMANNGGLKLGGEEREVTTMFADIRNFTTISEKMTPEEVVKMLNTCLPVLIDAIVQNGGLVNKFAGDNLMGVWNAPKPNPDHTRHAIKAALDGQANLRKMEATVPGMKGVQFGIGINTGKVLAGNIGSTGRVEYTVIGDEVNLASRICGSAPGGEVWVGPETYNQTKDYFTFDTLEPQMFKGKTKPVQIYRVTGFKEG